MLMQPVRSMEIAKGFQVSRTASYEARLPAHAARHRRTIHGSINKFANAIPLNNLLWLDIARHCAIVKLEIDAQQAHLFFDLKEMKPFNLCRAERRFNLNAERVNQAEPSPRQMTSNRHWVASEERGMGADQFGKGVVKHLVLRDGHGGGGCHSR